MLVLVFEKLSNPIQSWMVCVIAKRRLPTKQAERSGRTKAGPIDPTLHLEDDHDDEHEEDFVADFGATSVERSPPFFG